MKKKIYYHHTASCGTVYYAEYLKFFEEARTELLREKGIAIDRLIKEGSFFVVARQVVDYQIPAFYGNILEITSRIKKLTGAGIIFEHKVINQDNQTVVKAETFLVYVNSCLKPLPIQGEIRERLIQKPELNNIS